MIWIFLSFVWGMFGIGAFLLLKSRYDALLPLETSTQSHNQLPSVAVIIPARNEAENIAECLEGLIHQVYPAGNLQLVVVDDSSTDDTSLIAQHFKQRSVRVELLEAGPLPPSWLGKPHACWRGANSAQSDWLCFVDADTRHAPELLLSAVQAALEEDIDLLSLHPQQKMLGFWERLLMPIPFMTLMILLDARRINDLSSSKAMANGQFILINKEVYESIGGHAAIRDELLEDVAIARLAKSHGHNLKLFGGGSLIHTRMHAHLKTLWEGLARGGSELFGVPLTSLAVVNSLLVAFVPLAYPIWRVSEVNAAPGEITFLSALMACLGSVAWYGAHALALHTYHVPFRYLFLLPISNLLIAIVNAEGILRRIGGHRLWKGRTI